MLLGELANGVWGVRVGCGFSAKIALLEEKHQQLEAELVAVEHEISILK